jgi:hypothetical protein
VKLMVAGLERTAVIASHNEHFPSVELTSSAVVLTVIVAAQAADADAASATATARSRKPPLPTHRF